MKSRAAILVESNAPLVIDEIEIPALQCGQVLVRVYRSGICGAQLNEIAALKGPDRFLPHLLGHEGGAEVVDIGPGVTHVKPGDRAVLHWRKGAGIHSATPKYRWGDKIVNSGWVTTFNEYAVVSENRVTAVPKDVDLEVAALMGCAITTGLGLITNDAKLKIGESVLIYGAGGVGMTTIVGAALMSAWPIIAVDLYDDKLEHAQKLGATHVINASRENVADTVLEILSKEGIDIGIDVAVETTGITDLIEEAYQLTGKEGRVVCVGVPHHEQDITIHSLPLHFGKTITGCEGGGTVPERDIPRYLKLHAQNRLPCRDFVTHRFPLEQVNDALDLMRAGKAGRVVLEIE